MVKLHSMNEIKKSINKKLPTINYTYKNIILYLIILLVCIISLYYIYTYFINVYFNNSVTVINGSSEVETVKRPFLNLQAVKKDGSEVKTNIIFITHSFSRDDILCINICIVIKIVFTSLCGVAKIMG